MLEEIKEALISKKQQELNQRKQIDQEIKELITERDQKHQQAIQKLSQLGTEIYSLNNKSFHTIFHGKEIRKLCIDYTNLSSKTIDDIKDLNIKIESLYKKIYDLSHDEAIIEREIEKIRQATSLQELGLNEKSALQYIKDDEKRVIRAVFKDIKDNQPLETSTEIDRNMNMLFQTNLSPFVMAMQKISLDDLAKELIDIGIEVEEDKFIFLRDLITYTQNPTKESFPINSSQVRENRLDNNFYNQVEQDLANMARYSSYTTIILSKITTLAVLTSMAKMNKKQNQNQK